MQGVWHLYDFSFSKQVEIFLQNFYGNVNIKWEINYF